MDTFSGDQLRKLMQKREGPCISIYMPTYRKGVDTQQNPIRYKNLLRETEERLLSSGLRPQEVKELLAPAQTIANDMPFWRNQSDGLALFCSPEFFTYYKLPQQFAELVVMADRFHTKPLIPILSGDLDFYIMAVTRKSVRLFECSRYSINELNVEDVSTGLAEAFRYKELEKEFQFHTRMHSDGSVGHGGGADDPKDYILRYFQQVDKGFREFMRDKNIPLVFAGVDYLFSIFREANSYQYLMEKGIIGNPVGLSPDELHKEACSIVNPVFNKTKLEAIAQYMQNAGTGLASTDIEEVVRASCHGRVGLLFVAVGRQQWGAYDSDTDEVCLGDERERGYEDLLDLACIQTFLNGGRVYVVEPEDVPAEAPLAAVFRY